MQYLKINTCKGLHILLCVALCVAYNANYKQNNIKQLVTHTKQSINIHAKAYKVIAMQSKAIKH